MTLPIEAAVRSLARSAEQKACDAKLERRLCDLQALLVEDLTWVERALAEAVNRGERPARDAARLLFVNGGKRIRPTALLLSAACFGAVPPAARELGLVAELVHGATLLHDDVIDDGTERRGAATARTLWGNAVSVLGGDLLLVEALERSGRAAPEVLPSLFATLRELVDGEVVQLRGRLELDVSRDTYDHVLRGKTASLFRFVTSTGARLGGATAEDQARFGSFGELVGMAFQLVDDVLDYVGEGTDKTSLADLRDGKMTLPLVLALERHPDLVTLVRRIHGGDDSVVPEVRRRVVESGTCEEVRKLAAANTERALVLLREVPRSAARSLLEDVVEELAERRR
jgi:octaprenyl-diphosphate synthase